MKKQENNLIDIETLAKKSGVKIGLLSRYVREKFLAYGKQDNNGKRFYDQKKALACIKKIKELDKEGYTKKEVRDFLALENNVTVVVFKDPSTGKVTKIRIPG